MLHPRHAVRAALAFALAIAPLAVAPATALAEHAEGDVYAADAANTGLVLHLDADQAVETNGHLYNFTFTGQNYRADLGNAGLYQTTAAEAQKVADNEGVSDEDLKFHKQIKANATARDYVLKFLPKDAAAFPHAGVYQYVVQQAKTPDYTSSGVIYDSKKDLATGAVPDKYVLYVSVRNPTDAEKTAGKTGLQYGDITMTTYVDKDGDDIPDEYKEDDENGPKKVNPVVPDTGETGGTLKAMSAGETPEGAKVEDSTKPKSENTYYTVNADNTTGSDITAARFSFVNSYANSKSKLTISMTATGVNSAGQTLEDWVDFTKKFKLTPVFELPAYVLQNGKNITIKLGIGEQTKDQAAEITLTADNDNLIKLAEATDKAKLQLKHGDTVTFYDLPVGTKFTVNEGETTNEIAFTGYANWRPQAEYNYKTASQVATSTTFGGTNHYSDTDVAFGAQLKVEKTGEDVSHSTIIGAGANTLDFVNVADSAAFDPNPTGLIQRNLPYILVIGGAAAGIAILALLSFRRDEDADAE